MPAMSKELINQTVLAFHRGQNFQFYSRPFPVFGHLSHLVIDHQKTIIVFFVKH